MERDFVQVAVLIKDYQCIKQSEYPCGNKLVFKMSNTCTIQRFGYAKNEETDLVII